LHGGDIERGGVDVDAVCAVEGGAVDAGGAAGVDADAGGLQLAVAVVSQRPDR